jgi:uncharacterized membrane protein
MPLAQPVHSSGRPRPRLQAEHLIAGMLLFFGTALALLMPPGQVPDEAAHFYRAYHLARGHLFLDRSQNTVGCSVPSQFIDLFGGFSHLSAHPERHTTAAELRRYWSLPCRPEPAVWLELEGAAYSNWVPYVPQAAVIRACGWLGLNGLRTLYLVRLAQLLLAAAVVFVAVRLAPCGKLALGAVCLLPISVQQFASASSDTSLLAACVLFVALVLRAAAAAGPVGYRAMMGLALAACWVLACKLPYATLALFGLACCFALVAAAGLAVSLTVKPHLPRETTCSGQRIQIQAQSEYVAHHPLRFLRIAAQVFQESAGRWLLEMGQLGWFDTSVDRLLVVLALVGCVLGSVVRWQDEPVLGARSRLAALTAAAAVVLAVELSLYVWWTPLAAADIYGLQPRYFLPALMLVLLPAANPAVQWRGSPQRWLGVCAAVWGVVLLGTLITVARRYYLSRPTAWSSPLLPLFVSVVLVLIPWRSLLPRRARAV